MPNLVDADMKMKIVVKSAAAAAAKPNVLRDGLTLVERYMSEVTSIK